MYLAPGFVRDEAPPLRSYPYYRNRPDIVSCPNGRSEGLTLTNRVDMDIASVANTALRENAEIQATDIALKVTDGVIALGGYVRRFSDKYRAEDLVKCLPGVLAVANDIEVLSSSPESVSDPELARAAVGALRRVLPSSCWQIRLTVRRRIITLEGVLERDLERTRALAAIRLLPGVEAIVDLLLLESPSPHKTRDRVQVL
jgi:osmotically-inducible protein OsmY